MSLILFLSAVLMAFILLTIAMVLWLSEVLGSLLLATLVVWVLDIIFAVVIYYVSLHSSIKRISQRLDTIYEVSAMFEMAYRQVVLFVKKVMGGS